MPRLLAIHAGVSMLAQAARNTYLAPSLDLPEDAFGLTQRIAEGVLGVWLITGFQIHAHAPADRRDLRGDPVQRDVVLPGQRGADGHLPIYGAMLALLVYRSSRDLAPELDRFQWRPPDVSASRRTEPARR